MKKRIIIVSEVTVEIPDNKVQQYLIPYRDTIDKTANENELAKSIALSIDGMDTFIEGVGRVSLNGEDTHPESDESKALDINTTYKFIEADIEDIKD